MSKGGLFRGVKGCASPDVNRQLYEWGEWGFWKGEAKERERKRKRERSTKTDEREEGHARNQYSYLTSSCLKGINT